MQAKKVSKKKRARKTTATSKGARRKGMRTKKAATTPVGDIMRNAAKAIESVAKNIRP